MNRVMKAFGLVVLICVGVRVAAEVVAPVLPYLVALFVLAVIFWYFVAGPRHGGDGS